MIAEKLSEEDLYDLSANISTLDCLIYGTFPDDINKYFLS